MSQQSKDGRASVTWHSPEPEPKIDISDPKPEDKGEDENLSLEEALSTL